ALQRVSEVLEGRAEVLALPRIPGREALQHALKALACLRLERVEALVEVHRGGGFVLLDDASARNLRGVVRSRREREVAVRDGGKRRDPDNRGGALVEWREV